jgi:hypothetical protein
VAASAQSAGSREWRQAAERDRHVLVPHRLHQVAETPTQHTILDDRDTPGLSVAAAGREPGVVENLSD